jgi:hypothetical protein
LYAIVWSAFTALVGVYIGVNYNYAVAMILCGLSMYFVGVFMGTFLGKQQVNDYD